MEFLIKEEQVDVSEADDFVDSDFYDIFTSFVKGKVPRTILSNCQLLFKCKNCQVIQSTFATYIQHFKKCRLINDAAKENASRNSSCSGTKLSNGDSLELNGKNGGKKDHVCRICREEFGSNLKLERHNSISHSKTGFGKPLECNLCQFKSSSATLCIGHCRVKHDLAVSKSRVLDHFSPLNCGRPLNPSSLKNKTGGALESVDGGYKCKLCDFKSFSEFQCRKHARSIHKRNTNSRKNFYSIFADRSLPQSRYVSYIDEVASMPEVKVSIDKDEPIASDTETADRYTVILQDRHEDKVDYDKLLCKLCKKSFVNYFILRQHLAVAHLGFGRYKCRRCEFISNHVNECRKHALDAHSVTFLWGLDFKKNFLEINCLPMEKSKMLEDLNTSAKERNANLHNTDNSYCVVLKDELKSHLDFVDMQCLLCNKNVSTNFLLRRHLAIVHLGYKRFKCKVCQFKSSALSDCRKHARLAHAVKFSSLNEIRTFFDEIKCGFPAANGCGNRIVDDTGEYTVVLDKEIEGKVDPKSNFCRVCNQHFSGIYSLRQHFAVFHLGIPKYKCRACAFKNSSVQDCRKHTLVAHKSVCTLKSLRKYFYELRCIVPTNKPISTDGIEKQRSQNETPNRSKNPSLESPGRGRIPSSSYKIIADDKKYWVVLNDGCTNIVDFKTLNCIVCNRKFTSNYALRRHLIEFHLGFKRYKCGKCEFMGGSPVECKTHWKEIHKATCTLKNFTRFFFTIKCITPGMRSN